MQVYDLKQKHNYRIVGITVKYAGQIYVVQDDCWGGTLLVQLDVAPTNSIEPIRVSNSTEVTELNTAAVKANYPERWDAVVAKYPAIG